MFLNTQRGHESRCSLKFTHLRVNSCSKNNNVYLFSAENTESGENIGIFRSAGALARAIAPFFTCTGFFILSFISYTLITF